MANKSKAEMLHTLRSLVQEALTLHAAGAVHARLSRVSGAVDGYMRALIDAGIASERELLALMSEERRNAGGPATRAVEDEAHVAAA